MLVYEQLVARCSCWKVSTEVSTRIRNPAEKSLRCRTDHLMEHLGVAILIVLHALHTDSTLKIPR